MSNTMNLQCLPILTFTLFALSAHGAITPHKFESTTSGSFTLFRIELPRPSDAESDESFMPTVPGYNRFPQVISMPPSAATCYVHLEETEEWSPLKPTNIFYGITTATTPLELKFIYPKAGGGWAQDDMTLDLSKAGKLQKRSITDSGKSRDLTPQQQFLRARAGYFDLMSKTIPADGGFFNYAKLQALREAQLTSLTKMLEGPNGLAWQVDANRDDLYEMATGARALQETLQLDRVLGGNTAHEPRSIDIKSVQGVDTKSHPFEEMLKGKTARHSDLARLVPGDQYYARFKNPAKVHELGELVQKWGASLLSAPDINQSDSGLLARIQNQICIPSDALSAKLSSPLVEEMAVTGSDPYFREGTDITVIFRTGNPQGFSTAMDPMWKLAQQTAGADSGTTTIAGATTEYIVTPGRAVSAYRTTMDGIVVYSNSPAALQRIVETKTEPAASLASSLDFQYMRAIWQLDEAREDGFIFLSDAFIRRLVGPETRIKEKRRLQALGSMRMVMNAAMLHGYNNGAGALPSLAQMQSEGLLQPGDTALPDGTLQWIPAIAQASSSVYGSPQFLTPLCELPIDTVTKSESEEYERFRSRYQEYWRQYFDPVGVRLKLDKTLTMDTYILPLINETAYEHLKQLTGTKAAKFDLNSVSTNTLIRWQVRLDRDSEESRQGRQMLGGLMGKDSAFMEWLGEWAAFWVEDSEVSAGLLGDALGSRLIDEEEPARGAAQNLRSFFDLPVAAGFEVKNKLSLAGFLVGLQAMANTAAPGMVMFVPQEPYNGTTLVKIIPAPGGQIQAELDREQRAAEQAALESDSATSGSNRSNSTTRSTTGTTDIGIYYGGIGDGFYVSTKGEVLRHVVDGIAGSKSTPREIEYNALMIASPEAAVKSRPAIETATASYMRSVERDRLRQAWLLWRCGLIQSSTDATSISRHWLSTPGSLPSGGTITFDPATDQAVSSVYGPMRQLKKDIIPKESNGLMQLFDSIRNLRAWLRFTEDGLATHIELERK